MMYFTNLGKYLAGFMLLGTIRYKPGWNALYFFPLYVFDYGSHVLTGGAVISWSRWFHEHREINRVAKFFDRFLNKFDDKHGAESGPALWGTQDCSITTRTISTLFWLAAGIWTYVT